MFLTWYHQWKGWWKLQRKWSTGNCWHHFDAPEAYAIRRDHSGSYDEQKYYMLVTWKRHKGNGATWRALAKASFKLQDQVLVGKIVKLCKFSCIHYARAKPTGTLFLYITAQRGDFKERMCEQPTCTPTEIDKDEHAPQLCMNNYMSVKALRDCNICFLYL